MKSEGNEDDPTFTMSDGGRGTTCWLPTADENIAQGVSLQLTDVHTQALSMGQRVPIGFTVAIQAGQDRALALCWLNSGEIVVKGPLISGQYKMHSITWLEAGTPRFARWPAAFPNMFLPAQRPYQPASRAVIDAWWATDHCRVWMGEVARYDGAIAAAANLRDIEAVINPDYDPS